MSLEAARARMVSQQVRTWEVLDQRVLEVLGKIPRDTFVSERFQNLAYADTQIPLDHDQCMMTPSVEGRLLQALDLTDESAVLEIGTGSGFLTACLAELSASVHSIDFYEDFVTEASARIRELGYKNTMIETADATGFDRVGEYDAIAVTASLPVYDSRFERALKPGGRLFVIVGSGPAMEARRVVRINEGEWATESLFETSIKPMINAKTPETFEF